MNDIRMISTVEMAITPHQSVTEKSMKKTAALKKHETSRFDRRDDM
jgi:hypothetical protein